MTTTQELARRRGRAWAEELADAMIGPAATWPETWGAPYGLAVPQVRDLTEDPTELHRLAALAYFAAAERWDELIVDRRQEEARAPAPALGG